MSEGEPTYRPAPDGGRVRVPAEFGEPIRAEIVAPGPRGLGVEMMFIRKSLDPEGEADGAAYEAVANILMGRDQLERLVPMLQQVLEYWEGEGI